MKRIIYYISYLILLAACGKLPEDLTKKDKPKDHPTKTVHLNYDVCDQMMTDSDTTNFMILTSVEVYILQGDKFYIFNTDTATVDLIVAGTIEMDEICSVTVRDGLVSDIQFIQPEPSPTPSPTPTPAPSSGGGSHGGCWGWFCN